MHVFTILIFYLVLLLRIEHFKLMYYFQKLNYYVNLIKYIGLV